MQEPKEAFKTMLQMAGENAVKANSGKTDDHEREKAETYLHLLLLGILLFVGADALKVLFRANFGNKSISLLRIGIASLVFFIWATACILIATLTTDENAIDFFQMSGGQPALYIIALFYFILGLAVLLIGWKERAISKTSKRVSDYGGDNLILGYLIQRGVGKNTINMLMEPLFIFSIGILFTGINVMLGAPIVACSLSLFLYQVYEKYVIESNDVQQVLQREGIQQEKNYTDVS